MYKETLEIERQINNKIRSVKYKIQDLHRDQVIVLAAVGIGLGAAMTWSIRHFDYPKEEE